MGNWRIGMVRPQVSGPGVFWAASREKGDQLHGGTPKMNIKRYGAEGGKASGGQHLPFARAVEAAGWLYVSGQVPMAGGEVVEGNITMQAHQAIRNLIAVLREAGYGLSTWCVAVCGWMIRATFIPSMRYSSIFRCESARPGLRGFEHGSGLQSRD